jgi:AP-4 complex subunit beta-1
MNLLDPVLGRYSPGAVIATIRAFWSIAEAVGGNGTDAMKRQIVTRVRAPLVTLISSCSSELGYSLLKHAEALIDAVPGVFDEEYRQFFVKFNEPTHVKYLKIGILPKLANPENAPDIVAELAECVYDMNVKISRYSVRSMTQVACRDTGGPGCAESIARRLVEMLDLNVPHICSEAATALASVLRKHPSLKSVIAPPLSRSLKYIDEPSGKASIIYLLGECGDSVNMAPYALEKLIDSYDSMDDYTVKIALLSSTMKLFCQRPPEVQAMLGRLLAKATDDVSSQDLHDRALLYYRLLGSGVDLNVLQQVVDTKMALAQGINFSEENDFELRTELMKEFNTLAILFGKTSANFIAEEFQVQFVKQPKEHPLAPGTDSAAPPEPIHVPVIQSTASSAAIAPAPSGDLLDILGLGDSAPPSPTVSSSGPPFSAAVRLTGDEYQSTWGGISDLQSLVTMVPLKRIPSSTEQVEAALAKHNIMTMASGELPTEFKFFLYAQESASNSLMLIQGNLDKQAGEALLVLTVKINGGDGGPLDQTKVDKLTAVLSTALL